MWSRIARDHEPLPGPSSSTVESGRSRGSIRAGTPRGTSRRTCAPDCGGVGWEIATRRCRCRSHSRRQSSARLWMARGRNLATGGVGALGRTVQCDSSREHCIPRARGLRRRPRRRSVTVRRRTASRRCGSRRHRRARAWADGSGPGSTRPSPHRRRATMPVVVDDQHPAGRQPRVQVLELVTRRLVPVGVEAQQRYPLRRVRRDASPRPCPRRTGSARRGSRRPHGRRTRSSTRGVGSATRPRASPARGAPSAAVPVQCTSPLVGGGMPANVSKRTVHAVRPSSRSVRAAAIMLPPRQTPHSTIAPGTRVRTICRTASARVTSASGDAIV